MVTNISLRSQIKAGAVTPLSYVTCEENVMRRCWRSGLEEDWRGERSVNSSGGNISPAVRKTCLESCEIMAFYC